MSAVKVSVDFEVDRWDGIRARIRRKDPRARRNPMNGEKMRSGNAHPKPIHCPSRMKNTTSATR
jgi:hypothetical protein